MTKVKICGLTNSDDVRVCVRAGADFIGFVLSPSPRRVDLDQLEHLVGALNGTCYCVGVFATEDDLLRYALTCTVELDYYQVYFDPPVLSDRPPRLGWIRAHLMNGANLPAQALLTTPALLDFKHSTFEHMHTLIEPHREIIDSSIILAGNLTPDNVGGVVRTLKPWGVDVARGTESIPGKKDHALIAQFMKSVHYAH